MNVEELNGKRIAVLLSGGVDSSVAVYELARLGLHPDCFYVSDTDVTATHHVPCVGSELLSS